MAADVSLSGQAFVFFAMVLCGIVCGIVFDFFRSIRRVHHAGNGVVALQDIVFWLIELVFVYFAAFGLNYAKLRAYEALALVIGSFLYFMTLSSYTLRLFCTVMGFVSKLVSYITSPIAKFAARSKAFCRKKTQLLSHKIKAVSMGFSVPKRLSDTVETIKKNIKKHLYNLR